MPRATRKIPSGRNDPRHHAGHRKGGHKSNARDVAMKSGDLRDSPISARSRFSRKQKTQFEISHETEPFEKASLSGPYKKRRSRKVSPTYADARRASR